MKLELFTQHLKGVKVGWGNSIFSDRIKGSNKLSPRAGMMVPTFKILTDLIEILEDPKQGIDHDDSNCPHLEKSKSYDEIINTQQELSI